MANSLNSISLVCTYSKKNFYTTLICIINNVKFLHASKVLG